MLKIGVLALQGAFREHEEAFERLDVKTTFVRKPEDLSGCQALVLPGGETTTQRKLARAYGLWEPLQAACRGGLPVMATCAGLILLASRVDGKAGLSLAALDIDVLRNDYGRQVHSFETRLSAPCLDSGAGPQEAFTAIFIRSPRIVRTGPDVAVLATHQDEPAAVRQGRVLGLAFHPELTADDRWHRYFLESVMG